MGIQSNEEDWHEFYSEWADRFLLFARQQTRSRVDAEDVLQEAFVHIWSRRHMFVRIEPGLVFMQIRRFAVDRARHEDRRQQRELDYASEREYWFTPAIGGPESGEMETFLRNLPPEQQEVVVLKIWGDQTFEEIGKTLDISPNTAASRFRYGLEKLRTEMNTGLSK
jgi:RNA polymerase sigma-70 factor (ECF subfamily)